MTLRCLKNDGEIHDASWKYINDAWLPAITVCGQNLDPVAIPTGEPLTYEVVAMVVNEDSTTVTPTANRTICQFSAPITGELNFTADVSGCEVGDELVVIFEADEEATVIHFDGTVFEIDGNGNAEETANMNPNSDRWVTVFTFTGEKFISTYEHC